MIDFSRNHFELFGLPTRFGIDAEALDRAYRALQSTVHPDRFAGRDDTGQRLALQSSARVNEAYRALKDPVERARYLLALRGVDALDETDTRLPLAFLEAQLERRERAAEAAEAGDSDRLDRLLAEVRRELRARQDEVGALLDRAEAAPLARERVRELRFLAKLAEDVDAMLGTLDA